MSIFLRLVLKGPLAPQISKGPTVKKLTCQFFDTWNLSIFFTSSKYFAFFLKNIQQEVDSTPK